MLQNQRKKLSQLSHDFAKSLKISAESHIIPYLIGENKKAVSTAEELQAKGFFVLPIRYPTVPKNTARLRFSLHAGLSFKELQPVISFLTNKP